jgi:hypothetical protein
MGNIFLLGANRSIDTSKQVVEVNQIIRMEGYYYDSEDPQFMDSFEVAMLLQEAQAQQKQEEDEQGKITPPNKLTGANGTKTGKNACTLVEYSAKAVAVFGDTKTIKDELKAMGGKFNARLTLNGKKFAGWIFSKSQEQQLTCYFGLD